MERINSPRLIYCAQSIADLLSSKEQVIEDSRDPYFYISKHPYWMFIISEQLMDELHFPLSHHCKKQARLCGYTWGKHHGAIVALPQVKLTGEEDLRFVMVEDGTGQVRMELSGNIREVKSPCDILVGAGYTTARNQTDIFTIKDIDVGFGFNFEKLLPQQATKAPCLLGVLGC